MIRKPEEQPMTTRPQMYDGAGTVQLRALLNGPEEMNGKGRLFSVLSVPVGGSIGYHVHEKDSETFYILAGQGEFDDNGEATHPCGPGDVLMTPAGNGHAIRNTGNVPLEFMALILYA